MRILYVSAGALYSGAEECLRGLVEQLARRGYEQAAVVGAEGLLAERLRQAGCETTAANFNLLTAGRALAEEVLDAVRPSILHANGSVSEAFLEVARERSIPVVVHTRMAVFAETGAFHAADRVIAVSEFAGARLVAAGVPAEKISVVYEGVDTDRFRPGCFDRETCRARLEVPENAFVAVMIARPTPSKRYDLMIDALAETRANGIDARAVFVGAFGDPPYLRDMRVRADRLGLAQHIEWLPFQPDIRLVECAADAVVLPSDDEALGMCSLEAMALEVPVIVSDAGGGRELVEDRESGLVMQGGNPAVLAECLRRLAADSGYRGRIGRHGRRRACALFTLERHAERMASLFEAERRVRC